MKYVFFDQMSGETLKTFTTISGNPIEIPNFININQERYAYVYADRRVDENRKQYMAVIVTKVIPCTHGKVDVKPFAESETVARLKTSPDGNSQIFTCIEGKVFHRSKIDCRIWSAWTQYV